MSMQYQNFASLGVNLNRQKYGPLDISNVFTSAADLKYYLTKGAFTEGVSDYWYKNANEKVVPYPYEGQVLATVIDGVVNVYALSLDAEGNFQTQEIAGKIEVDDKTVKLNADGKIELVGLDKVEAGKTYVPSLVNGVLTWAEPDTTTADGQAQEINALKTRTAALEATVNGIEASEGVEAVDGLVDKVAANAQAIAAETEARADAIAALSDKIGEAAKPESTEGAGDAVEASGIYAAIEAAEARAKAYADANDTDTVYDDTGLKNRVSVIEGDYLKQADKYDDTALTGRVAAIESDYLKTADKYDDTALKNRVKALEDEERYDDTELSGRVADLEVAINGNDTIEGLEARVETMEAFWAVTEDSDGVIDTLKEIQEYVTSDKSGAAEMAGNIQKNTTAIATLNGNDEGSVNKKIADAIAPLATTEALNGVKATAEAAATKEYTDAELAKKVSATDYEADKATFALSADVNAALAAKADANAVVANSTFETFKTENTQAIAAAKSGAISEIEANGYAVATEVANTYATKTALGEAIDGIEDELLAYAKTEDVVAELAKKADSTAVYTKAEVDAKIGTPGVPAVTNEEGVEITPAVQGTGVFANAYSRAEVDKLLDEVQGGSSASADSVLRQLNTYKSTNDERVGGIETKNGEQDTAIAAAQAQADKGVADAKKVSDDLVTANLAIAENTREIGVAKSSIETVNTSLTEKITALENKDTGFTTSITALETLTSGHTTTIAEQGTKIAALESKDTELAALIQANTDKFGDYYDKTAVDAKVKEALDAVSEIDLEPYAKTEDVNSELAVINEAIATKANAADVYTKEAADGKFQTAEQVAASINALINAADPDGGKTIENIQNLVKYVDENAGEIAGLLNSVSANTTAIGTNTENIAALNTTVGNIDAAVKAIVQPKESVEISVATTGELGIKEVNVNKLVQTDGDVLILNGGNA